jgi:NADPH:quinone reductase-like Zn-dependent oxidoreductase
MTRVVVAPAYGGPEVLAVVDEPVAGPGPGQVLVEVRAAGVNPVDWKTYSGEMGADPGRLPIRLGSEVSGVVTATGPDATGPAGAIAVGDEVIGFRVAGGYAEQVVVPASAVVPKPAGMAWPQAAGLMLTGATAVHALTAVGVGAGDTLLVHGASGGVGLMLLQLAAARGARVIGTAGRDGAALVRRFGGEPVAYGDGLADRVRALAPEGVTAAIDTVGTDEAVDVSLQLLPDRDRFVTIAAFARGAMLDLKRIGGGPGADPGTAIRDAARLELTRLVDAGALTVVVDATFPLDRVADAHRQGMRGHSHGKLVLLP